MTNRTIVCGALVIIVGMGGLMWWNRQSPPKTSANDPRKELDEIRSELEQLKESRATDQLLASRLGNGIGRPTEEPQHPTSGTSESPKSTRGDDPSQDPEQQADELQKQVMSHLDSTFNSQKVDSNWSRNATNEATRALSASLPEGSSISKVDCRTNLCRVETTHKNADALRAYNQTAFLSRDRKLWNAGVYSTIRAESPSGIQVVSFIAKEGESVPLPTDTDNQ